MDLHVLVLSHHLLSPSAGMAVPTTLSLKVATWNVLADCYAGAGNYWHKRRSSLQQNLKLLLSSHDLLLLQEVDHANDFYRPLLKSFGYECCYLQRPSKDDGCLIAFPSSKFSLVSRDEINFNDLTEKFHEMDIARQSFRRHNVALVICLKDLRPQQSCSGSADGGVCGQDQCDRYLIVSTAHLYWNPSYPEVKSGQAKYLLDRIAIFRTKLNLGCGYCSSSSLDGSTQTCHPCPVILGGDFNSTPESEQYDLLTSYQPDISQYLPACRSCGSQQGGSSKPPPPLSHYFHGCYYGGNQTKFLCDPTLSKLCRWLRVLGLNAAMHRSSASAEPKSKKKQKPNG
jgi:mRNA deadenylase 3'-5' endonuclease subunit Ccr4